MAKYYKFMSSIDDAKYLLEGSLKFSSIKGLNDPSEMVPRINKEDVEKSLHCLRQRGYTDHDMTYLRQQGAIMDRLAPGLRYRSVPSTKEEATRAIKAIAYDNSDQLIKFVRDVCSRVSDGVGVFCVSRRHASLPMWAHYAANGKGCVVELDGLDLAFGGDETGLLNRLTNMIYEEEKISITFDPSTVHQLFFSKLSDWQYEKETRIVRPLNECKSVEIPGGSIYVHNIPAKHVSRLIVWGTGSGDEMSQRVGLAKRLIRDHNPRAQLAIASYKDGAIVTKDYL